MTPLMHKWSWPAICHAAKTLRSSNQTAGTAYIVRCIEAPLKGLDDLPLSWIGIVWNQKVVAAGITASVAGHDT